MPTFRRANSKTIWKFFMRSLAEHHGAGLAKLFLDPLLRKVRTFDFEFCQPWTYDSTPRRTTGARSAIFSNREGRAC